MKKQILLFIIILLFSCFKSETAKVDFNNINTWYSIKSETLLQLMREKFFSPDNYSEKIL